MARMLNNGYVYEKQTNSDRPTFNNKRLKAVQFDVNITSVFKHIAYSSERNDWRNECLQKFSVFAEFVDNCSGWLCVT